jgi:hypothetical protein
MTFHFRNSGLTPPTWADCKAVADAYGLWENTGYGLGYAQLRSSEGSFIRADCWSLDDRVPARFQDQDFDRPGLWPPFVGMPLPTTLAPLIRWGTSERGLASGRTYAVGLSVDMQDPGDLELVNGPARDELAAAFGDLSGAITSGAPDYRQCVVSGKRSLTSESLRVPLDITSVGVYALMGAQRRRTRPTNGG